MTSELNTLANNTPYTSSNPSQKTTKSPRTGRQTYTPSLILSGNTTPFTPSARSASPWMNTLPTFKFSTTTPTPVSHKTPHTNTHQLSMVPKYSVRPKTTIALLQILMAYSVCKLLSARCCYMVGPSTKISLQTSASQGISKRLPHKQSTMPLCIYLATLPPTPATALLFEPATQSQLITPTQHTSTPPKLAAVLAPTACYQKKSQCQPTTAPYSPLLK